MADPVFFNRAGPFSLLQLAEIAKAKISGTDNHEELFEDVAPLDTAGTKDISFLDNKKYIDAFSKTNAGVCIVHPDLASRAPNGTILLVTEKPYQAYAKVAQAFYPDQRCKAQISANASIDKTATIGKGCRVDDGAFIGAGATIGDGSHIAHGSFIGTGVKLGSGCVVGHNVTIQYAIVGNGCIFHPGVRIGQDGFGFAPGSPPEGHIKVPQLGRVLIGDMVEIGSNTTIDRGAGPDTKIGDGTKIDNLVQIGHNVEIGMGCFIAGLVGISGSTKIGNFVMLGGQSGYAGHIKVGDGAQIAAQSGVMRDVDPGSRLVGAPAIPDREFFRQVAALSKLAKSKNIKKWKPEN